MKYILIIFIVSLSLFQCADRIELNSRKLGKLLATVDSSSIYDSTLIEQHPFLRGSNDFMKVNYVNKWVSRELILKKMYSDEFHKKAKIKKRLLKMQEDFLITAYMTELLEDDRIPKDDLLEYYNTNLSEFSIPENEYKYQLVYFDNREHSKKVYTYLRERNKFDFNALKNSLSRLIIQKEIVGKFTSEKNIESKKIKEILSALKVGSFSWPMKYEDNYIIVKLLDKRVKGDPYPFIEVEGKIMLKEYSKHEQKKYHSIVDSMKTYSDVKVYINGEIDE